MLHFFLYDHSFGERRYYWNHIYLLAIQLKAKKDKSIKLHKNIQDIVSILCVVILKQN